MLKIVNLTETFHNSNQGLAEALHDKKRGYGIVTVKINNLTFGIPLRSSLNHQYGVVLDIVKRSGRTYRRGLDFTKAVLIRDEAKELGQPFFVGQDQKKTLISKKKVIINQFERYVSNYVSAAQRGVQSTLKSPAYKYSTLTNFHKELGI